MRWELGGGKPVTVLLRGPLNACPNQRSHIAIFYWPKVKRFSDLDRSYCLDAEVMLLASFPRLCQEMAHVPIPYCIQDNLPIYPSDKSKFMYSLQHWIRYKQAVSKSRYGLWTYGIGCGRRGYYNVQFRSVDGVEALKEICRGTEIATFWAQKTQKVELNSMFWGCKWFGSLSYFNLGQDTKEQVQKRHACHFLGAVIFILYLNRGARENLLELK